jgi:lactoylglutathione lyase
MEQQERRASERAAHLPAVRPKLVDDLLVEVVGGCHGTMNPPRCRRIPRSDMGRDDFPAPEHDFLLTHFLVVSDMDRSREFYRSMLGGTVVNERSPVIMRVANSWLILNEGGGPTDDKPDVILETPPDPNRTSAFLNIRVADIAAVYDEWRRKGVEFLTEPKDHGREIRAYVRDPDGHLIEVGQSTGILDRS